jgi:hypothetical protein
MATESAETVLAALLRFQAKACEGLGSALYAALLKRAAADVEANGPTWAVLRGHEDDPGASALALRFMGAVNRLVLAGREPALDAVYGGFAGDEESAWAAFSAVVERNVEELRELVHLPVQTNEAGRSAALLLGFLMVAAETTMPLRLLEAGASAGLNLRWDRYRYLADGLEWGPDDSPVTIEFELSGGSYPDAGPVEVSDRRGCDAAPLDPTTAEGRLTLLAYIWPDQRTRIERMEAALSLAEPVPVTVDREQAAPWVERQLARSTPGEATVLFHSIFSQYMSEAERDAFHRHIEAAATRASADAPLAWLRMEHAGERAELRLTTWPGGADRLLAGPATTAPRCGEPVAGRPYVQTPQFLLSHIGRRRRVPLRPQAAHLRHGNPHGDSERFKAEAAPPPPAQARLEGQALPLGPRRRVRLASPGLHRPSQAQAQAGAPSRPGAQAGGPLRLSSRRSQPRSPSGRCLSGAVRAGAG